MNPPRKPPGQYGAVEVSGIGVRCIAVLVMADEAAINAYLKEWQELNLRHGLRPSSTQHFITSTQDSK